MDQFAPLERGSLHLIAGAPLTHLSISECVQQIARAHLPDVENCGLLHTKAARRREDDRAARTHT